MEQCVWRVYSVIASINEDEAQEALLGVVSQRCCYGKAAVNEMDIYQIISTCALHVSQLTFSLRHFITRQRRRRLQSRRGRKLAIFRQTAANFPQKEK